MRNDCRFLLAGVIFALVTSVPRAAPGEVLFQEDFEEYDVGSEPDRWTYDATAEVPNIGFVDVDPLDPDNQVFTGFGGYQADNGALFDDFVAQWDWLFEDLARNDSFGFRVQGPNGHYQLSRRVGGVDWHIYRFDGAWSVIGMSFFEVEANKWYRIRLIVDGGEFLVKVKERDDETPFDDLDPLLEVIDDAFEEGTFSTSYWGPVDNVIIAESEEDIDALENPDPGGAAFRRGDINGDGLADISDAVSTLGWLFGGATTPGCLAATDVNGDGLSDISDAIALLSHLFLGSAAPAAPFPGCGPGSLATDAELGCVTPPGDC
jgi:hypothetical protein